MKISDIYSFLDSFAPFSSQASWDNSGLLAGDMNGCVHKAVVALDVTENEIKKAVETGAELIITHHPLIFRPVKNVLAGSVLSSAVKNGISVISAHTNLDKAKGGVNDTLCKVLKLRYEKAPPEIAEGFLNTGFLPSEMTASEAAHYIKNILGGEVSYSDGGRKITKVAVCSGAGADFTGEALKLNCQALITGDASYHDFLDAKNAGLSLFAAGHFETEVIIVNELIRILSSEFGDIEFIASDIKSPVITVK